MNSAINMFDEKGNKLIVVDVLGHYINEMCKLGFVVYI